MGEYSQSLGHLGEQKVSMTGLSLSTSERRGREEREQSSQVQKPGGSEGQRDQGAKLLDYIGKGSLAPWAGEF